MADKPQTSPRADILILETLYKNPMEAFLFRPKSIAEIKDKCLVFLDTSMLMLPYDTGPTSLNEIKRIYESLTAKNQLFLPRRAIQEFSNGASRKLSEIYHKLRNVGEISANLPDTPDMLRELEEFTPLKEAEAAINKALAEYRTHFEKLLSRMSTWNHDDPVRTVYQSIFNDNHVADFQAKPECIKEWEFRHANRIPPGYLDAEKKDSGIGDYLVWRAILEKCMNDKKDAIFVTNDTKEDSWHGRLFARSELVEEFREATGGRTIRLLQPKDFLKLYGASEDSIADVSIASSWKEFTQILDQVTFTSLEDLQNLTTETIDYLIKREGLDIYGIDQHKDYYELLATSNGDFRIYVQQTNSPTRGVPLAIERGLKKHSMRVAENGDAKTIVLIALSGDRINEAIAIASAFSIFGKFEIWLASVTSNFTIRTVAKITGD